jgi:hypothetical protein
MMNIAQSGTTVEKTIGEFRIDRIASKEMNRRRSGTDRDHKRETEE